jgi:eukaryotic-like serine/threonine-protein kinase
MPLAPGTKLGPYEILAPLGAGGMGEVYRARDARLERSVAIKILPAEFSTDPVRKQRFEREAKTISSLNHPHICTLHDVGNQDGISYLVMECVEGETLAKRLEKGPLPLEQVHKYGMQIADALDKAHRSGVVHRDLKPGNIMITATGAKLLDFGLSKPAAPLANLATLTAAAVRSSPVTEQGTIVGTFQYMSPEQVEGKELDGRSDIFSLGAVLYEMLTGQRAFEGKSQLSVASAILEKEPTAISTVKPLTPPALDHAIKKCLAKLTDERWQSASDLASELKWIGESGSQGGAPVTLGTRRIRREAALGIIAGLLGILLLATITIVVQRWRSSPERGLTIRFALPPPEKGSFESGLALSPDGRQLAFVVQTTGKRQIWLRSLNVMEARPLPGTENGWQPFWSPDGRYVAFFADGKLKKLEVASGAVETLCDASDPRGGAWNRNGVILFSPTSISPLYEVSAEGGAPSPVTTLDVTEKENSHRWPYFLPDGRHFLYMRYQSGRTRMPIWLGSLDSKDRKRVLESVSMVEYTEPGFLIYVREHSLVAHGFEAKNLELKGNPFPLAESLEAEGVNGITGRASFTVAEGGVLAYLAGGHRLRQLTWYDRKGKVLGVTGPPADYDEPAMSLDGKYVAVTHGTLGFGNSIWIHDLTRTIQSRLTFGSAEYVIAPLWTPDGNRIIFSSDRKGPADLYWKPSNGTGKEELLFGSESNKTPDDVSRDGRYLIFENVSPANGRSELWVLPLVGERKPKPYLQTESNLARAAVSPDGHWVAYSSDESGRNEIFLQSFPEAGAKFQISNDGGDCPLWRNDGKELFYVGGSDSIVAVPVETGATFRAAARQTLFRVPRLPNLASSRTVFVLSPDGQRILVNQLLEESNQTPVSVVANWDAELKKQ